MPDATQLLEQDHREVERLFTEFELTGERAIALQICDELDVHTTVEEEIVYPVLAEDVDGSLAEEGKEEHEEADRIMNQIRGLAEDDGRLRTFVARLKDAVMHHVEEEEEEAFPKLRDRAGERLERLGQELAQRKEQLRSNGGHASANLVDLTKDELYERAREAGIAGRSNMTKDALVEALQKQG